MKEKFDITLQYFHKMSALKKVLIVFVTLLIFIIVVEQPGSDSSKRIKNERFFIPKMSIDQVGKIDIKNPNADKSVILEKKDNKWRVTNGNSLPAAESKVGDFLKALLDLKEGDMVSKNKDRVDIFSVDEANGIHVLISDDNNRNVADFYAGAAMPDSQYLRRADSYDVYQAMPSLMTFLSQNTDGWKDKTLLSAEEKNVRRVALKGPNENLVLEKNTSGVWHVVQPEDYEADSLSVRTLFDQLKSVEADSFADSVEASQAKFDNPDYTISIRMADDSLSMVAFSTSDKKDEYFAKNGESGFVYLVSSKMIDNIFGLKFKTNDTTTQRYDDTTKKIKN
jgi:hypothetical protein